MKMPGLQRLKQSELMHELRSREEGTVLVIVAVVMVALLGFAGLAIDFGYAFVQKTRMQALVDAQALGCAQRGCVDDPAGTGLNATLFTPLEQPFDMGGVVVKVNTNYTCPDGIDDDCIRVNAKKTWNTFFLRMFDKQELSVNASAIAKGGEDPGELGTAPAIMALGPGRGGVEIVRQNAEVDVRIEGDVISNSNKGVTANTGWLMPPAQIKGDVYTMGAVENIDVQGQIHAVRPNNPVPDPCPSSLPAPQFCNKNSVPCLTVPQCTSNNQTVVVPSGAYEEFTLVQSSSRIGCKFKLSGVYTISDEMEIETHGTNARVDATDAIFITNKEVEEIEIKMSGSGHQINMSAPTTGAYAGILFWQTANKDQTLSASMSALTSSINLNGVYYVPGGSLTVEKSGVLPSSVMSVTGLIARDVTIENSNVFGSDLIVREPSMSGVCSREGSGQGGSGTGGGKGRLLD